MRRDERTIAKKKSVIDSFFNDFDSHQEEVDNLSGRLLKDLAPGTKRQHEFALNFLMQFGQEWCQRSESALPFEEYMRFNPTLMLPRNFWILLCKACCVPSIFSTTKSEAVAFAMNIEPSPTTVFDSQFVLQPSSKTVIHKVIDCITVYQRATGLTITKNLRSEIVIFVQDYLRPKLNLRGMGTTLWATFPDIVDIVSNNIFGKSAPIFKCARERNQLALLIALIAFTAARPGELVLAEGYTRESDSLQYKDLDFAIVLGSDGVPRIHLDICIRNMKGLRKTEQYRKQPLYEDESLPFCVDATLLAFSTALQDEVFVDSEEFDLSAYKDIQPSAFPSNKVIRLYIKPEKAQTCVFRRMVKNDSNKTWTVSPNGGYLYYEMRHCLLKVVERSNFRNFNLYMIRRCVATALNDPAVTSDDARRAIGHRPGSYIYENHYVSKRTEIDIQGLVSTGKENRDIIAHRGLERLQFATLTEVEMRKINQSDDILLANLADKKKIQDEILQKYPNVTAAKGTEIFDRWMDRTQAVRYYRDFLYEKAEKEKRNLMEAEFRKNGLRDLTSSVSDVIDGIAQEVQQLAVQPQNEQAQLAVGVPSSVDQLNDDTLDPTLLHLEYPSHGSGADQINKISSCGPNANAIALKQFLSSLQERFGNQATYCKDHLAPVIAAKRAISFADVHNILLSDQGTLEADWLKECKGCGKEHPPAREPAKRRDHVKFCVRDTIIRECQSFILNTFVDQESKEFKCLFPNCGFQISDTSSGNPKKVVDHICSHALLTFKLPTVLLHCTIDDSDGTPCGFRLCHTEDGNRVVNAYEAASSQRIAWRIHLEQSHGFFQPQNDCVKYCSLHEEWLIGWHATEEHFRGHYNDLISESDELDVQKYCKFCFDDPNLSFTQRAMHYDKTLALRQHINGVHIFPYLQREMECPTCHQLVRTDLFPDHLADHGYRLSKNVSHASLLAGKPHVDGDYEKLFCATDSSTLDKKARWIQYAIELRDGNLESLAGLEQEYRHLTNRPLVDDQDNEKKLEHIRKIKRESTRRKRAKQTEEQRAALRAYDKARYPMKKATRDAKRAAQKAAKLAEAGVTGPSRLPEAGVAGPSRLPAIGVAGPSRLPAVGVGKVGESSSASITVLGESTNTVSSNVGRRKRVIMDSDDE